MLMRRRADAPLLGIAAATVAVVCCAGLPAIAALLGGITFAAVLGVAGVVVASAALVGGALLMIRAPRRRAQCEPPAQGRTL